MRILRRLGPGLVSQGLNSVGNLLLVVLVAGASGAADFGAWSIGYAVYTSLLVLSRSVASTPMLIAEDDSPDAARADEIGSVALAGALGVATGLPLAAASFVLPQATQQALLVFGLAMPLLLVEDALRHVWFLRKRESIAALMDLGWFLIQLAGSLLLVWRWPDRPMLLMLAWVVGAVLAVAVGLLAWRHLPPPSAVRDFLSRHRSASGLLTVDAVLVSASGMLLPLLLTATSGLAAAGALRGGNSLMGGIALLVMGLTPMFTVEAANQVRAGRPLERLLRLWTVAIAGLSAVYGAALFVLPQRWGTALLGDSWSGASSILLPLVIQAVIRGPFTGVPLALRASRALGEMVRLRIGTSVVNTMLPLLGGLVAGLQGAAWAIVAAAIINNVQSLHSWRHTRPTPGVSEPDE